ncbi:hypothetical protein HYH02_003103 [Chlamydomonas schloesseri]|uniref:Uncharacterized protein n=1 Tax=Chlamydomonas schloesseri TaxID=2026947 RepID=A0A835WQJ6_9CHLO|nr:hypothetical protein HYH02_003103 [Chlamydomonas schloesseri]|eukprot:KAG2452067.1 hypothetical protein HYH02_003103 [Chlamydomonas schloesseri]
MAAPPDKLLESYAASTAYCALTLLSSICNLACVGFSALMTSSVNLLTDEITACSSTPLGFILLLVALVLFAVYTYPPIVACVCGGLAVAAAMLVITVYFVADYDRFYHLQDAVNIILGQDSAATTAKRGMKDGGRGGDSSGGDLHAAAGAQKRVHGGNEAVGAGRAGGGGGGGGGWGRAAAALQQLQQT